MMMTSVLRKAVKRFLFNSEEKHSRRVAIILHMLACLLLSVMCKQTLINRFPVNFQTQVVHQSCKFTILSKSKEKRDQRGGETSFMSLIKSAARWI